MNSLRNRVNLIGNLGQDPEFKTLDNGKKITKFTLATSEEFKNAEGQKVKETTWHNIVAWNGIADVSNRFLKKGAQVAVEGKIAYHNYEDKNGVARHFTEIVIHDLVMLRSQKAEVKEDSSE